MKSQRPKTALSPKVQRNDVTKTPTRAARTKNLFETNTVGIGSQTKSKNVKRPQTSNSNTLATKKWRAAHFHSGAPASRREVELLGEWLNSVLADNLENHDNPIDIVTNAQHWYSVAFNELIRQVSVTCAERGRLFACIWKRNQDLFQRLIEIQRQEREYILTCHKDRVQFLKTDLEFCNSRLNTIKQSYADEKRRWESNREKDISKFSSLQAKIDQQIQDRNKLQQEIADLEKQLGIESKPDDNNDDSDENVFSYDYDTLCSKLQKMRSEIRNEKKIEQKDIQFALSDIMHYLEFTEQKTLNIRLKYEYLFLSLPTDVKPTMRTAKWVNGALSLIYSSYICTLSHSDDAFHSVVNFPLFLHQSLLHIFGNRFQAEQTLLDLLTSAKTYSDEGNSRHTLFLRFIGYNNPLPSFALHYYLYCLVTISNMTGECLFPEAEGNEGNIAGIPVDIAYKAVNQIISKFSTGKLQKFYTDRIDKIANNGILRFGGRPFAELDSILESLLNAFLEEERKIEDGILEQVRNLSSQQIWTFSDLMSIAQAIKIKLPHQVYSDIMTNCLKEKNGFPIRGELILKQLKQRGYTIPFEVKRDDFMFDPTPKDIQPFVLSEFEAHKEEYENILNKLTERDDDIQVKQLKAAKIKFDQSFSGRTSFKVYENNVREFFEKLNLLRFI